MNDVQRSMSGITAEKRFYDRQLLRAGVAATREEALAALCKPGTRYHALHDFLPDARCLSAVEWGFGSYAMAAALSQIFGSYQALDICADRIVDGAATTFRFSVHNLNEDLPFADESFDVSIAMMVIEHLFDPFHSFREIARTTKRGGHAFINLPLVSSAKNRVSLLFGRLPMTSSPYWWELEAWDGGHLHYFTIPTVKLLGIKYGLALDRIYPVGKLLWLKRARPTLFCHEASFVFTKA